MAVASVGEVAKLVDAVVAAAKKAEDGDPSERVRPLPPCLLPLPSNSRGAAPHSCPHTQPQERAVDGLKALLKLDVTTKVLAETQAGKRVRALTKHSSPGVSTAANEVVKAWKHLVRCETAGGSRQQASSAAEPSGPTQLQPQPSRPEVGSGASGSGNPPAEALPPAASDPEAAAAGPSASPAAAAPPAGIPPTGDSVRDKCRANLVADLALAVGEGSVGFDPVAVGVAVEEALCKGHKGVTPGYKAKFRQLHFNLKDDKNPDLRRRVLEGGVAAEELIEMAPEELASDAKREDNQRIRERKLFDAAPYSAKQATTDQFQCGKCRQRKCTYYQMQTRSADEPMTTFVSCLNCNNRWKFC